MAAVLKAKSRPDLRRSTTRQLRLDGYVPAVLYGKKVDSQAVAVLNNEFIKTIRQVGRNGILQLEIDKDNKHQVMVNDYDRDPIKDQLLHIDFFEVDMTTEMDADVSVKLIGKAAGESDGGIVSHLLYELSVRALPNEFPEELEVDISELNIGDTIQVKDIKVSGNFEINNDPEETVVTVLAPSEEVEEQAPSEGDEPELVGNTDSDNDEE